MTKIKDRAAVQKSLQIGRACACFNLRRATRALTQMYDDALRPAGLRTTQFTLLSAICVAGPVTVQRLATAVVMDRTTLTRDLRPLERQGLVSIEPGEDRRERKVDLTPEGAQVINRALPLWEKAQAQVSKGLGQDRLHRLLDDLSAAVALTRAGEKHAELMFRSAFVQSTAPKPNGRRHYPGTRD
jgi:DNA-binding MarR family transcriptional regulator